MQSPSAWRLCQLVALAELPALRSSCAHTQSAVVCARPGQTHSDTRSLGSACLCACYFSLARKRLTLNAESLLKTRRGLGGAMWLEESQEEKEAEFARSICIYIYILYTDAVSFMWSPVHDPHIQGHSRNTAQCALADRESGFRNMRAN